MSVALLTTTALLGQQAPPQFRTWTTLVPVDVRVLDRNGKPITDLTQADFTVFEDGVPQTISHFARQPLVATKPEVGPARLPRNTRSLDAEPANRRVFLLLLGRGRLRASRTSSATTRPARTGTGAIGGAVFAGDLHDYAADVVGTRTVWVR
jgi:hypothetical protein